MLFLGRDMIDEYGVIDFDGENFCMSMLESIAVSFREEMIERYPLFYMGPINYNSINYFFRFGFNTDMLPILVGSITITDDILLILYDHNKFTNHKEGHAWCYTLADPKSLSSIFDILDRYQYAKSRTSNEKIVFEFCRTFKATL